MTDGKKPESPLDDSVTFSGTTLPLVEIIVRQSSLDDGGEVAFFGVGLVVGFGLGWLIF